MKKTKHTPGPWEIGALLGDPGGKSYEYPTIYRRNEDGSTTYVADIMGALAPCAWPNARLIAAAPDLLKTGKALVSELESLLDYCNHIDDPDTEAALGHFKIAIAKAEGREE